MFELKIQGHKGETQNKSADISKVWKDDRYLEMRLIPDYGTKTEVAITTLFLIGSFLYVLMNIGRIPVQFIILSILAIIIYLYTRRNSLVNILNMLLGLLTVAYLYWIFSIVLFKHIFEINIQSNWLCPDFKLSCSRFDSEFNGLYQLFPFFVLLISLVTLYIWLHKAFSVLSYVKIYILEMGEPLPLITHKSKGLSQDKFHLAIRITDPNVRKRYNDYIDNSVSFRIFDSKIKSQLDEMKLASSEAVYSKAENFAFQLQRANEFGLLVRLILGLVLYQKSYDRFSNEKPKNHLLWFAFTTHRQFICLWLLFIVYSFIFNDLANYYYSTNPTLFSQYSMLATTIPIIWLLLASFAHSRIIKQWKNWSLVHWSTNVLGGSPLFLARESQWEELHEEDFDMRISEFGLSSMEMFNISAALFFIAALTFLQLIK